MLEKLKAYQGKKIVLELANGRVIPGTVMAVDQQFVRVGTEDGVGTIPVDAVQIIWEPSKRSLTEENMEQIADKMRDSVKDNLVCYPNPFNCPVNYGCMPPHLCYPNFLCGPADFSPQAGGPPGCTTGYTCTGSFYGLGCQPPGFSHYSVPDGGPVSSEPVCGPSRFRPYCRPFEFGHHCVPYPFGQPICEPFRFRPHCGPLEFGQPCVPFPFGRPCGSFQFAHPCGSFQFGHPCGSFQFGQPCVPYQFGQPCVPFPFGSQCVTPGGFACAGAQFFGAPAKPPGMVSNEPPLPPQDFSIKEDKSKDSKKE